MTEFYTHVAVHSNKILFRGVNSKGERFSEYRDFSPTVFVPSPKRTEYQSLEGKFLQPFTAGDMRSMKDYIEKYSNVSGLKCMVMRTGSFSISQTTSKAMLIGRLIE